MNGKIILLKNYALHPEKGSTTLNAALFRMQCPSDNRRAYETVYQTDEETAKHIVYGPF